MTRQSGRVALVTGAARGQGRSHCLRLAAEGADIVAVDICADVPGIEYAMATEAELQETAALVEKAGRRVLASQVDVRDALGLQRVVRQSMDELGGLDVVVANAGVLAGLAGTAEEEVEPLTKWRDVVDIDLTGVFNTVWAAAPAMIEQGRGGSIAIISSLGGLKGGDNLQAGSIAYTAAKHGVVGIMRQYAIGLAPHLIRVNSIHPTGVRTEMILNDAAKTFFGQYPARGNPMPVDVVESEDISNAVAWLAGPEARYITGVALPIDAGYNLY